MIYYFTRWLPGAERGKAIAIFLSGSAIASLISGPLSGLLLQINGLGMHGWQWMYFIEGMFSVCLCVFVWFWLDAKPHDAKWLSRAEQDALVTAIDDEQKAREAATPIRPSMGKLLKDRQILLFCLIYFFIQLTIYAATFWLPSIIKKMGDLSDVQVGLFNSIPWLLSMVHVALPPSPPNGNTSRHGSPPPVNRCAGMFMSTTGGPIFAFVAICFAALGFKSASSLFWPIPQAYLDARIAAAVIALITRGQLGGFVAPTTFGLLEDTRARSWCLSAWPLPSIIAAIIVFFPAPSRSRLRICYS